MGVSFGPRLLLTTAISIHILMIRGRWIGLVSGRMQSGLWLWYKAFVILFVSLVRRMHS